MNDLTTETLPRHRPGNLPETPGVQPLSPRARGVGERGANCSLGARPLCPSPSPAREEGGHSGAAGAIARAALVALAALALAPAARADGGARLPPDTPAAYRAECGSCHVAYPPGLLPAASWQRIMAGLDRHFGSDASLDEATRQSLGRWLQAQAGTSRRVREAPPEDRITRSAWFAREHRRVAPAVWQHPSVRSPAQCAACHRGAEGGRYDEDELRAPPALLRH